MPQPTPTPTVADLIAVLQTFPPDMLVMTTEVPGDTEVMPMQYGPHDGKGPHSSTDERGNLWLNCVCIRGADGLFDDDEDDDG